MVLSGLASTFDVDNERVRFLPRAFGPLPKSLPLLFEHDPDQVAGTVDELSYDQTGNLCVTVTATHQLARRCNAFSVGAKVRDYVVSDEGPSFFATVREAVLTDGDGGCLPWQLSGHSSRVSHKMARQLLDPKRTWAVLDCCRAN